MYLIELGDVGECKKKCKVLIDLRSVRSLLGEIRGIRLSFKEKLERNLIRSNEFAQRYSR